MSSGNSNGAAVSMNGSGVVGVGSELESLKTAGNSLFAQAQYSQALETFTQAIDKALEQIKSEADGADTATDPATATATPSPSPSSSSSPVRSLLPILYSNRSATNAALRDYDAALRDAERVISLRSEWAKGYARKGAALEGLHMYQQAALAYKQGLQRDPNDAALKKCSAEMSSLLRELSLPEPSLSSKSSSSSSSSSDGDAFDNLIEWLREGGSRFNKLYLRTYSAEHRGVHALAPIQPDELILYVPHHQVMTSAVAMESGIGKQMVDQGLELRSKHSYLAAYLLQERAKGKESYWYPYIQSLPKTYANMPIFFKPDLLRLLKGSFTLDKISDRLESLRAEYNNICQHVPDMRQFTHEEFVWARMAVITRIFGLMIKGVKTDGLVPYADMLNHKRPREHNETDTRWTFDDTMNGFTITALREINRGEQVYDSYGRKCNSRFFVNYGFALEDNEEDNEAVIRLSIPADAPALSLKTRLVGGRNLLGVREFQVPATYRETHDRERKTKEMFAFARFALANEAELVEMSSRAGEMNQAGGGHGGPFRIEEIEPVTTRLEAEVLKFIQAGARASLEAFETTIEEDNAILASGVYNNNPNARNCIVMRRGEKQVLKWFDNLATKAVPLLGMKWNDLRKMAGKFLSPSARDHYVTHVVAQLVKAGR